MIFSLNSFAQGGPPSPPDGGGGPGTVNDIPINMYLIVMLFVGAFYGLKKVSGPNLAFSARSVDNKRLVSIKG